MIDAKSQVPLYMEPIEGPPIPPILVRGLTSATFGRSASCTWLLDHHAVSREHMAVSTRDGVWYVTDHVSRNGTRLNGVLLPAGEPTPIADTDHLQVGPWTFRIRLGDPGTRIATATVDDDETNYTRLQSTSGSSGEPRVKEQFASLLRASAMLQAARDEPELLEALLQAGHAATGFERAAVIRRGETFESVEVVAHMKRGDEKSTKKPEGFHFSRSLLRAASTAPFAVVSEGLATPRPETLVRFDIAAAACAPIRLNEAVWGYLYLDSGASTPPTGTDELLELTRTIADMGSLALSRVKQSEVSERLRSLQNDVEAAAEIQRFLLPAGDGRIGRVVYSMRTKPGRMVSGDIFDIIQIGDDRIAIIMGDVMGKGLGSGLLMASVLSYLHCVLKTEPEPSVALEMLHAYLTPRMSTGRFVSLWLGILEPATGRLTAADAGHGLSILVTPEQGSLTLQCSGGTPLGAQEQCNYPSTSISVPRDSRLVLFSDGVIDTRSSAGEPFGLQRLLELLPRAASPQQDIDTIFAQIERFAGPSAPADDRTAASITVAR